MACKNNLADQMMNQFFSLAPIGDSRLRVAPTATGGLGLRSYEDAEAELQRQRKREEEYRFYADSCQDEELKELRGQLQMSKLPEGASQNSQFSEVDDTTTVGCLQDVNELQQEEAAQIYDNYYPTFNIRYNPSLVIARYRQKILSAIHTHSVVIIRGTTGCGKTTQVPQFILDEHAERGVHCNIIVTQPRRIAATSVARRVCQERNWTLGTVVGYQIALDSQTCPDTRITYVTTGVLLQKLIVLKNMNNYTHIIIDEVHERDQDTDLTLLIVRKFLRTNSKATKVILMSATIDTDIFADYFKSPVQDKLLPAPTIDIDSKPFTVVEHYITELATLGQVPIVEFENPCINPLSYDLACKLISTFDYIEEQEQSDDGDDAETRAARLRGSVLVFLPGYEEISEMQSRLMKDREKKKWWILPLHSSITSEEQQNVFKVPITGSRKIILSTNIAESSITVPDIRYVIDFCLTKILISDPDTNYCSLQVQWASKSSCDQRRGRAGRVSQGRVYRMVPASFYDRYLELYSIPEMKRCPLELVVLKVKSLDMGEPKALLALALERPDLMDIERAILVLKEVGALSTTVNDVYSSSDGDMTYIGLVMSQLPLDVHVSKLILLGFVFDCLEECIIIAASLSVVNFFSKPFQEILKCYKSRLSWACDTFSDVFAYLAAYTVWQNNRKNGFFHRMGANKARHCEETWARNSYLQLRRIKEVSLLVEELKRRLQKVGIRTIPRNVPDFQFDKVDNVLILKVVICGAFYPNYFVQEEMDQKDIYKQIVNLNPRNTVVVSNLPPKYPFLYESALVNLFRECSPHVQVHFDNQKAFIQFGKNAGEKGTGVLQEVYIALKMRHQRKRVSVPALSTEEVNQKLQIIEKLKAEQKTKLNTFGSSRKDVYITQNVLPRVQLPKLDQITVRLNVTHVVDCGHFWAQYMDMEDVPGNEAFLERKINMYGGDNLQPIKSKLQRGMLVLAPWGDRKLYYRAYIEDLPGEKTAEVFFLDYGNSAIVKNEELREIDSQLGSEILTIPALAVQCKLSEIRPVANRATKFGHWSDKARKDFTSYVLETELIGQVYSVVECIIRLQLRKVLSDEDEVNINQHLILMGHAEPAEEDYMSMQNHMLRQQCQDMDRTQVGQLNQLQQQDNVLRLSQNESIFPKVVLPQHFSRPTYEHNLRGPASPLEVSYCGVTKLTSGRRIRIERDSVNSVTLNREPENPHSCMLVACYVSLDSSGSAILARNTTEMPRIHGLPALMSLLFCPQAEFRTDPQRSKYTGAIAGLGVCPATGKPVYPEHDIEMVFDTVIDLEDIVDINKVRMYMNYILGKSDTNLQSGPALIQECQGKARKALLSLLNKKRAYQEQQQFGHPFMWNKIDPKHKSPPDLDLDCPLLFKMHDNVHLVDISGWVSEQLQQLKICAADRSAEVDVNKCPLCDCTCYTRSELRLHLSSDEHQKKAIYYMEPDYQF